MITIVISILLLPSTTALATTNSITYRKSLLQKEIFQTIKDEIGGKVALKTALQKETSSIAKSRIGSEILKTSKTYEIIQNPQGKISQFINKMCGSGRMILSKDIPV